MVPSELLADATFLSEDETGYARAEAVFSAFSKEHYLDISTDDAEAVRAYIFDEETWYETAGESTYAVVSRVRTMLSTVASYTESPIDVPQDTSFARWFFSSAHEGNSAYFATVATMAFREQGIPVSVRTSAILRATTTEMCCLVRIKRMPGVRSIYKVSVGLLLK